MAVINISEELYELLQDKANLNQIPADELAELLLTQVLNNGDLESIYYPDTIELAELKQSIAEDKIEEAAGIGIPLEEAVNSVLERIKNRKNQLPRKASA
jgi:hypothetical protein